MDPWGDHLVTCKSNQITQRHAALRNAVASVLREHGLAVMVEQRVDVTTRDLRRPADVAILNLDPRGPLAVDFVVHHPTGLSLRRGEGEDAQTLKDAEEAKHRESEAFCHSHGWLFTAMGWNCWGGVGPRACALLRKLEKVIAGGLQGWPRRTAIRSFRQKLVFRLMAAIGGQLAAASDAFPLETSTGQEWRDPAEQPRDFQFYGPEDMAGWDEEEEEDPPEPLRVTLRRA